MEKKIVFWISFLFSLIVSFYFGYIDKLGAMSLSVVGGAIGMAFANLDKFTKIKGAGFEAELKKAVNEAYATTDSLKDLSANFAKPILAIIAEGGRWGGISLRN